MRAGGRAGGAHAMSSQIPNCRPIPCNLSPSDLRPDCGATRTGRWRGGGRAAGLAGLLGLERCVRLLLAIAAVGGTRFRIP